MRTRIYCRRDILVSAVLTMLFAGCEDAETTSAASGGIGGTASTNSTSSSAASGDVSSSSTGMMTDDGNSSIDTAEGIYVNTELSRELYPVDDVDYYWYVGEAGQTLYIYTNAEDRDKIAFDPAYIDTVITLFDENMQQLAENDNRIPRYSQDSALFTSLPADGLYYIRVTDCFSWNKNTSKCLPPIEKQKRFYKIGIIEADPNKHGEFTLDVENANGAAESIAYVKDKNGSYFISMIYGTFSDKIDSDVFSFMLPADIPSLPERRATGYFNLQPSGKTGTGSTTHVGRFYIAEAASPLVPIAEVNGAHNLELSPPLKTGKEYLLFVTHPEVTYEPNDFYFIAHFGAYRNPIELNNPGNGDIEGAELVAVKAVGNGKFSGFFEGDLGANGSDVDHFKATIPPMIGDVGSVSVDCLAMRRGSGLRNLTISLVARDENGATIPIPNAVVSESESKSAQIIGADIPKGAKEVILKLTATQDMVVKSSFYLCGIHFSL